MLEDNNYNPKLAEMLKYNDFNKPYIPNGIEFNISHSGDIIVLGTNSNGKIGIDTEEIKKLNVNDFKFYFTPPEWLKINSAKDPNIEFYKSWTQKEAVSKLLGLGLNINLTNINISNTTGSYEDILFSLKEIILCKKNITHIAIHESLAGQSIMVKKLNLETYEVINKSQ